MNTITVETDSGDDLEVDVDTVLTQIQDSDIIDEIVHRIAWDFTLQQKREIAMAINANLLPAKINSVDDELKMELVIEKFGNYTWTQMSEMFEQYERNNKNRGGTVNTGTLGNQSTGSNQG